MTVKFKTTEAVEAWEEVAVGALSTLAILAVPVLIILASA